MQTYYPNQIKKVAPFEYCLDHLTKVRDYTFSRSSREAVDSHCFTTNCPQLEAGKK